MHNPVFKISLKINSFWGIDNCFFLAQICVPFLNKTEYKTLITKHLKIDIDRNYTLTFRKKFIHPKKVTVCLYKGHWMRFF